MCGFVDGYLLNSEREGKGKGKGMFYLFVCLVDFCCGGGLIWIWNRRREGE